MPIHTEIKTSVVSRDGTQIAYWTSGAGPPIVLVHGAPADHTRLTISDQLRAQNPRYGGIALLRRRTKVDGVIQLSAQTPS
jgi:pimeloyl-ACP methyl ester carboxylesterase